MSDNQEVNERLKPLVMHGGVLLLYTIAIVILTWPLFCHMGMYISAGIGDNFLNLWILGWDIHSFLVGNLKHIFDSNSFYPYPSTLTYSENLFSTALVGLLPYVITKNFVITYNIIFFLGFILSGFTMYIFIKEFIPSYCGALLGGFIFSFNAWRFTHIMHIQIITAWWIPLCFWALVRYHRTHRLRFLIWLGIFFVFNALSNGYYMLFTSASLAIFEISFFVLMRQKHLSVRLLKKQWWHILILLLIIVPPILITYYPYKKTSELMNFQRGTWECVMYSADLRSFFVVPPGNLLWGRIMPFRSHPLGESIIFLGFFALALSIMGLYSGISHSDTYLRTILISSSITGLMAFLFSIGPEIARYQNVAVPGPYALLRIIPGFNGIRVPARFAVIIYFALALLVASGILYIEKKLTLKKIILFVMLLIMSEQISWPMILCKIPYQGKCPPVYKWLASQPPGAVMELPINARETPENLQPSMAESLYLYLSTYHWHPIFNGYSGYFPSLQIFASRTTPDKQLALASAIGIKYVIIHKDLLIRKYQQELLNFISTTSYEKLFEDNNTIAFRNPLDQKLPPLSLNRQIMVPSKFSDVIINRNIRLNFLYIGHSAIAMYPLRAFAQWYLGDKLIFKQMVPFNFLYPIVRYGDAAHLRFWSPPKRGFYMLHVSFPSTFSFSMPVHVR